MGPSDAQHHITSHSTSHHISISISISITSHRITSHHFAASHHVQNRIPSRPASTPITSFMIMNDH